MAELNPPVDKAWVGNIEWISDVPGGFISTDTRTGILRVWNVSNSNPEATHRLLPAPVHVIHEIENSGSGATSTFFTAFADGSVGVFNLQRSAWIYLRQGGHTETIFSCAFKAGESAGSDATLLATASFDATIKIWQIGSAPSSPFQTTALSSCTGSVGSMSTLAAPKTSTVETNGRSNVGQSGMDIVCADSYPPYEVGRVVNSEMSSVDGAIYSVAWAPGDCKLLVAGTSKGNVLVYDHEQSRLVAKHTKLHSAQVYHVSWSPHSQARQRRGSAASLREDQMSGVGVVASASGDKTWWV
ncbi:WD40-repeat-containing domain protein [Blyttiomyces helicus]|uniref:WD40-repeat-containing domain protein n=1 Tax=Blyttiomyces helicus TaxID=388810 RepID=A0A4P9WDL1_9FUNG|nr:WD40-repeat-containing domain protein [Blyttiomyces helicus]|eukprot:RKO89815.1 WD40-repeat-containing domain protein [Blyttiomyces helicus]